MKYDPVILKIYKTNRKHLEEAVKRFQNAQSSFNPKKIREYKNKIAMYTHIVREMQRVYHFK